MSNARLNSETGQTIPFHRPSLGEEEIAAVVSVLRSGWLTTGPVCEQLEQAVSRFTGARYAVAVGSCTAGLHILLRIAGVGRGDEVITTPFTFVSTVHSILHLGAIPVLADIDPVTLTIDPDQVKKKVSPKTRVILPVHYGGHLCEVGSLVEIAEDCGAKIIEDCAHSIEAKKNGVNAGLFGLGGAFSFYVTKNITAGEGGMIVTNDEEVYRSALSLRLHGMSYEAVDRYRLDGRPDYDVLDLGYKYNLSDIAAALANSQLAKVDSFFAERKRLWQRYSHALANIEQIEIPPNDYPFTHALHLYVIRLRDPSRRPDLISTLRKEGIGVSIHFQPVHLFTWYRDQFGYKPGDFPVSEYESSRVLSLPLYPGLSDSDQDRVIETIVRFFS